MRIFGAYSLKVILLIAFYVAAISATENTTVAISGTSSDGDAYSITFTIKNNKWSESEPSNSSKVFTTHSGVWQRGDNVTTLFKSDAATKVGTLKGFFPESAKKGLTGTGFPSESATGIDWVVQ